MTAHRCDLHRDEIAAYARSMTARLLSARRVRHLREQIAADRCPERPGLTHAWQREIGMDPMSFGGVIEWWECVKCSAVEW